VSIVVDSRFDSLADLGVAVGSLAATAFAVYPQARRAELVALRPTIDLDPTDIETYVPQVGEGLQPDLGPAFCPPGDAER